LCEETYPGWTNHGQIQTQKSRMQFLGMIKWHNVYPFKFPPSFTGDDNS